MTQEQTDNLINHYFSLFTTIRHVKFEQFDLVQLSSPLPDKDWRGVRDIMVSYGLIVIDNNGFTVTAFGSEVLRNGGWLNYLSDKKEEKKLTIESIQSSIRTNQSSELINSYQKRVIKWTIVFSIIATIVSLFSLFISYRGLRLQERLLELEEYKESGKQQLQQCPNKKTETVLPNQDSSKILKIDSLDNNLKVKQ